MEVLGRYLLSNNAQLTESQIFQLQDEQFVSWFRTYVSPITLWKGVSIAAFLGGNQVLGVVPKALAKEDIIGKTIGEKLQVSTMSDRMNTMFNHADAFIALPDGLGILEEIFHIFSWAQLHIHHKPIGLLNVNGFYDNLLSFLDQVVEQKFLTSSA
jgi:uncharacterized protein (TIGR00730 family)